MKIELKAGINSADARRRVPKTKVSMLNMFEKSPSFTMEALLRELKPYPAVDSLPESMADMAIVGKQ